MLFEKKIKRVVDVKKTEDEFKANGPLPLEKGDRAAIFLAALAVFGPALLIIGLLVWLVR